MAADRENRILELAEKYKQGLTIEDISKALEIARATAAKDLAVLVALEKLKKREIGKTKLHYLPKYFKEIKFSIIFLLSGFFVFQMFAADGIAIFHFNLVFQEVFVQALQSILFVVIFTFVGVFSICRITAGASPNFLRSFAGKKSRVEKCFVSESKKLIHMVQLFGPLTKKTITFFGEHDWNDKMKNTIETVNRSKNLKNMKIIDSKNAIGDIFV